MQELSQVSTIHDRFAKANHINKIEVIHPAGKVSFPYRDKQERASQLSSARTFANQQVDGIACYEVIDLVDIENKPLTRASLKI